MRLDTTSLLSDDDLVAEVARLAHSERNATASLIARLAELHRRRLHERAGFSSLFTYCTTVLRLSEHEAYDRMKAAKVARRFPTVLELLAAGRLNLTTIRRLAPHLTRENHAHLVASAVDKNKRQVQEMLACRLPQPDVVPSIRKVPMAVPRPGASAPENGAPLTLAAASPDAARPAGVPRAAAPPPTLIQPLAPDRYHVHFTAGASLRDKLQLARDLLRHSIPSGDPAEIVERALDALIEGLMKRKYAVTTSPRPACSRTRESRHVPAEVRRAVFARDAGRCAYVAAEGRRCDERGFVEFHHRNPYAVGGQATVDNIELRCRAHSAYEAEVFFGQRHDVSGPTRFRSGTRVPTADAWIPADWRTPPRTRSGRENPC